MSDGPPISYHQLQLAIGVFEYLGVEFGYCHVCVIQLALGVFEDFGVAGVAYCHVCVINHPQSEVFPI